MTPQNLKQDPRIMSLTRQFAARDKTDAVLRLLKGESLADVGKELGVATERLERWRNDFVTGGSAALSKRKSSGSQGWLAKNGTKVVQWVAFLVVLAAVIGALEVFLQRGSGE
jgi:transposase